MKRRGLEKLSKQSHEAAHFQGIRCQTFETNLFACQKNDKHVFSRRIRISFNFRFCVAFEARTAKIPLNIKEVNQSKQRPFSFIACVAGLMWEKWTQSILHKNVSGRWGPHFAASLTSSRTSEIIAKKESKAEILKTTNRLNSTEIRFDWVWLTMLAELSSALLELAKGL